MVKGKRKEKDEKHMRQYKLMNHKPSSKRIEIRNFHCSRLFESCGGLEIRWRREKWGVT
jgi:hypothetical protein